MTRSLFSLLLLFAIVPAIWAQELVSQPVRADQHLTGPVQTVVSVCRYTSGADLNREEQWNYDPSGALLSYVKRGFGGERVTTYPQRQNPNPLVQTDVDYDGDPVERRTFSSKHQLLSSQHFIYGAEGTLSVVIEYAYDIDKQGAVTSRKLSQYNRKGQILSVQLFDADENLLLKERYSYNRHGDLVSRIQCDYADKERSTTKERRKYTYDHRGNWTSCQYFHNDNLISTTTRTITYYD